MLRIAMPCLVHLLAAGPLAMAGCDDAGALPYEPRTFLGYACRDGCERHKAGFRWAERYAVTKPRRCLVLPKAESEGCEAFLEEGRQAEAAGERWAVENEILRPCECEGAGERFRAGCTGALHGPAGPAQ